MEERAGNVQVIETRLQEISSANGDIAPQDQGPGYQIVKKMCRDKLWNTEDVVDYLSGLTDERHIVDVSSYLNLIKEGNDAIRKKENPSLADTSVQKEDKRRSRRFDRDFYRTCVSEGLRSICYRFLLGPNRLGIKLEQVTDTPHGKQFDFSTLMPGETSPNGQNWVPPTISGSSPFDFALDLEGSGELVKLSSQAGLDITKEDDALRSCRYVAAMELAHEPRVRRYLRNLYRQNARLTTRPTKKGRELIDAFHEYYGLHLIKEKPVKEHFPVDEKEARERKIGMGPEAQNEFDTEMKKRERESCLLYMNLLKAEQTGHISVHIHLPLQEIPDDLFTSSNSDFFSDREKQQLNLLLDDVERLYLPMQSDTDSEEWNAERRKVLVQALTAFLLPQFEAETRRELREAAVKVGVKAAAENLHAMAMEGPYRPQYLAHTENRFLRPTGDLPMVGICVSSDNKEATYLASVTTRGELNDHVAIPGGARIDTGKYREQVITFLCQSRPAAVVIGTSGGFESRALTRKMTELVNEAVKRWENREIQGEDEDDDEFEERRNEFKAMAPANMPNDEYGDLDWKCNVDLVDDTVSQLFGRSVRGKKEFPDHAVNLRCAASIARHAKDPLAELTYAWGVASDTGTFGTEMLYLNIHPMQQLMPRTLLLREYERTLCEVVAEVGCDVNACCHFDHLHGLLTFVPGMGPRKAASLKHALSQIGGSIGSRRSLLEKRMVGPIVYNNAVAFLRIQEVERAGPEQFLHPLDNTRLHPDVYHRNNWAIKIAIDALERAEDDSSKKEEEAGIQALNDAMKNSAEEVARLFNATKAEWESMYGPTFNVADWNPRISVPEDGWHDKVEELDLDTFSDIIETSGVGKWNSHLQMIKWEFRLPFADPRKPMEPLMGEKLFKLITGETDQSMRPGKEVTGKVVRNGDFGSRIKLEGDIPAFIPLRNLADEHVETAEDIVNVGQVVTAIVTEVKKDHFCVDLSLKMEDFRRSTTGWDRPPSLPPLDAHFDRQASQVLEEKKTKEREARLEALQLKFNSANLGQGEDASSKSRMGRITRRACAHPAFRNAKHDDVERELREGGAAMIGEALVRPSSKNSDSLAIHWVVKEGSIKMIEVTEEDKDTEASIGNVLKIKGEVYGSIDELLGRYIAPMNDFVEELTNHRKFLDLSEDDIDEKLRQDKTKQPDKIPYHFCWMEMHPGYASLRFMLTSTARNTPVGITPNGFSWGSKTYPNLNQLVNAFKHNPRAGVVKKQAPANSRGAAKDGAGAARPSRWGNKQPAPPSAPPPPPVWNAPPPPGPPPMQTGGWGAAQASSGGTGGGQWNQPPPPGPGGYSRPPPPSQPPPPGYGRPPPPSYPPTGTGGSYQSYQQPPPPGYAPR